MLASTGTFVNERRSSCVWKEVSRCSASTAAATAAPRASSTPRRASLGRFGAAGCFVGSAGDRKSTRLNSSHGYISYAVFCLKKKKNKRLVHCFGYEVS